MKTCERIQNWILTDYMDGCLSSESNCILQQHVAACASCRSLMEQVQMDILEPMQSLSQGPSLNKQAIWRSVLDDIQEDKVSEAEPSWFQRLVSSFTFPQPAMMAFGGVLLLLCTVVTVRWVVPQNSTIQLAESTEVVEETLVYVMNELDVSDEEVSGYETSIEEYFL